MLDEAEIHLNLGRLACWLLMMAGASIVVANLIWFHPGFSALGATIFVGGCALAVIRSIHSHDTGLREAFEHGREHARLQTVEKMSR